MSPFAIIISIYLFEISLALPSKRVGRDTTCQDSGQCKCITPPYPENGSWSVPTHVSNPKVGDHLPPGSALTFFCNINFKLTSSFRVVLCNEDGWNNTFPSCVRTNPNAGTQSPVSASCTVPSWNVTETWQERDTPSVKVIGVGDYPPGSAVPIGSVLEFSCSYASRRLSPKTQKYIACDVNGWNDTFPECKEIDCTVPPYPEHGSWTVPGQHALVPPGHSIGGGATLTYSCEANYKLSPPTPSVVICTEDGWGVIPTCVEKEELSCTVPENLPNGQVNLHYAHIGRFGVGSHVQLGSVLAFSCDAEFTLSPATRTLSVCDVHGWGELPRCVTSSKFVCRLPPQLVHGAWSTRSDATHYLSGDAVANGTVLQYTCDEDYALFPNVASGVCQGSFGWNNIPKCLRKCPQIPTVGTRRSLCMLEDNIVSCGLPLDGTVANISCARYHESSDLKVNSVRTCKNATWDKEIPVCSPACGLKSKSARPLVINGTTAIEGEYPWHVGIYRSLNEENICGGSIISQRVIVTAAHCFDDSRQRNEYLVAAGKYYRLYNDPRDKHAQYSSIKELLVHPEYFEDLQGYQHDIAIIIVQTPFAITNVLQPVCVDMNANFDHRELVPVKGTLIGWGYTATGGTPSEYLKELQVDFKTNETCILSAEYRRQYYNSVPDKICAGLFNQGASACQGDSGGGLVFPKLGRFYLRGIVSLSAHTGRGECDSNGLTLYSSIRSHVDFIQHGIKKSL